MKKRGFVLFSPVLLGAVVSVFFSVFNTLIEMRMFVIVLFSLLFISCANENRELDVIPIHPNLMDSINIRDVIGEVRYITLDSHDSIPVIGNIAKLVVENSTIYISDGRALHSFSLEGKHLNTISKYGRGPGEYLGISDFCLGEEKVHILDNNGLLYTYTHQGEYKKSVKPDFYAASISTLPDNKLLLTSAYQSDADKLHIYDSESLQRSASFAPIKRSEMTWRHIKGQENFFRAGEELLYHEQMNDTVYSITNNLMEPKYVFVFEGKNAPQNFWEREYSSIMDIVMKLNAEGYAFGTPTFAEKDNKIILTYRVGSDAKLCLYYKNSKESVQTKNIYFEALGVSVPFDECRYSFRDSRNLAVAINLDDKIILCLDKAI